MRKNIGVVGRKVLASVLSMAMVLTATPGVFEKTIVSAAPASQEEVQTQDIPTEIPAELKREVELFSESGSLKHIYMDEEKYDDVFYDVNDPEQIGLKKDENYIGNKWQVEQIAEYNFQYRDLINNGDDGDNYCILIMGDGYTASEQDKFLQVAQSIANYFMTRSPFNESNIKNKINIRAVCTVSNHSGVQEAQNGANSPYDTFFKSTFWNNTIERLVCIHDYTHANEIISQYMPNCKCPIVVCNTTKYGGSGGGICTISANEKAPDIAFHEFGHTGAFLDDEYWEGTYESSNRHEGPNRTLVSNASSCKWADLIGQNGVGLYPFDEVGVYDCFRPHQRCEMRYLEQEFCEVCKRQIRKVINDVVANAVPKNAVISNASQLQDYCAKVNAGASTANKTVTLANDINLSGSNNLKYMKEFSGTFNGNGKKITGINMSSGDGTYGFIGTLKSKGVVKDLHLENVYIQGGGYYTGGIAGNVQGEIYASSVTGQVRGSNGVGGIAGHTESEAYIHDCYNAASVYASEQVSGGIVGWGGGGTVNNCFNYGSITSAQSWKGGISGYATDTTFTHNYFLSGSASYGVQGSGSADSKSSDEFKNGTVKNLLNSVNNIWTQGSNYPVHSFGGNVVVETTTQKQETTWNAFNTIEAEQFDSNSGGVKDNNSSASGGGNLGGVLNGVNITFNKVNFSEAASSIFFRLSCPSGTGGTIEVYCDGNKVGSIATQNNASGWSQYGDLQARLTTQIAAGTHSIKLNFVTNGTTYVCNLDYFKFIKANGDTTAPSGYTFATTSSGDQWYSAGDWSYYVGEWNGGTAYYKGGSKNDFTFQIAANNKAQWGIQLALDNQTVKDGHNYTYKINYTSTKAGTILHKEDVSNNGENRNDVVSGNNTITGTFTAAGTRAKLILELASGLDAGTEIHITGVTITDNTPVETTTVDDGFKAGVLNDWVTVGKNGLYFGDWAGTANCRYKGGNGQPFQIKVVEANKGAQWLIQSRYDESAIPGHTYKVTANVKLSQAGSVGMKEDISNGEGTDPVYTDFAANETKNIVATYNVASDKNTIRIMFELGQGIDAGTIVTINSVNIEDITVIETTTETPKPIEVTGLNVTSSKAQRISVSWSQTSEQIANGQTYNVYLDGSKKLSGVGSGNYNFDNVAAGNHTVKVTATLNGFETNGVSKTISVEPETTTEAPTEAPTENPTPVVINGYQISAKSNGFRCVYTVESKINNKNVAEVGMVYAIGDVADNQMVVGSSSADVRSFKATNAGKVSYKLGADSANTYAMTMMFGPGTASEFNAGMAMRAYAKLSDGTIKYSDVVRYTVYDVASYLYINRQMHSQADHDYLYNKILKVANKDYVPRTY
ncbi:MAG: carbohydrate-binding protein [Lachnospiraceae bacterium]|nr:carbohydrate-binding protein [Lachnospiraceae bacterium]